MSEFRVQATIASRDEVAALTSPRGFFARAFHKLAPLRYRSQYHEESQRYDANLFQLSGTVYIAGHWQSELYFRHITERLREDLRLRMPLSEAAKELSKEISSSSYPVAVHVRRGDYLSNPNAAKHHGVLDAPYYRKAMGQIDGDASPPTFFIFSDDPAWVRENLNGESIRVVPEGQRTDAEDLMLIAACRDHVISNSSFGWWGAWLSPSREKKIVAPKRWFLDPALDDRDIVPQSWIRV